MEFEMAQMELEVSLLKASLENWNFLFLNYFDEQRNELMAGELMYYLQSLETFNGPYPRNILDAIHAEVSRSLHSDSEDWDTALLIFNEQVIDTIREITGEEMPKVAQLYEEFAINIVNNLRNSTTT